MTRCELDHAGLDRMLSDWKARAERAETRVAELEAELAAAKKDRDYWGKSSENYAAKMVAYKLEIEGVNGLKALLARIRELEAGLLGCRQARSELEAELATERQAGQIELGQRIAWRIRAEKAETDARESLRLVRFLEARIAELKEAGKPANGRRIR